MKQEKKFNRLRSLDVFRGLTIVLMILVNSPGNNSPYSWLEHSDWNGCTLADWVFPFFIFIVGVSSVFTLSKAQEKGVPLGQLKLKILKRSLVLLSIGLLLNIFPNHFDLSSLRLPGVLQRIAICYGLASLLFITTSIRVQTILIAAVLILYYLLICWLPVPGYGLPGLSLEGNWVAYVDRIVFSSAHLYQKNFDPEGLLSTLPALATALIGNLTGSWLLSPVEEKKKLKGLCFAGLSVAVAGLLWGLVFPINKSLWSSSYVLWTAGLALLLFALCYWLIEIKKWQSWIRPFEIFGLSSMTAYVLHVLVLKIQAIIQIHDGQTVLNLRLFLTKHLFPWASVENAALFYALAYTMLCFFMIKIVYFWQKQTASKRAANSMSEA